MHFPRAVCAFFIFLGLLVCTRCRGMPTSDDDDSSKRLDHDDSSTCLGLRHGSYGAPARGSGGRPSSDIQAEALVGSGGMGRAAAAGTGLLESVVAGVGSAVGASRGAAGEPLGGSEGSSPRGRRGNSNDAPLQLYRKNEGTSPGTGSSRGISATPPTVEALPGSVAAGDWIASAGRARTENVTLGSAIQSEDATQGLPSGTRGVAGGGGDGMGTAEGDLARRAGESREHRGGAWRRATDPAGGSADRGCTTTATSPLSGGQDRGGEDHSGAREGRVGGGDTDNTSAGIGFSALGIASATGGAVLRGLWGGLQGAQSGSMARQGGSGASDGGEPPAIRLYRRDDDVDGER